jgi:hypothetical protein
MRTCFADYFGNYPIQYESIRIRRKYRPIYPYKKIPAISDPTKCGGTREVLIFSKITVLLLGDRGKIVFPRRGHGVGNPMEKTSTKTHI